MRNWYLLVLLFLKCFMWSNCEDDDLPSIPINLTSPSQTYGSVELEWSISNAVFDSGDYENDTVDAFIVVFSPPAPRACGCCSTDTNDSCVIPSNQTRLNVTGLMLHVNYTFTVYANSTEGLYLSGTDNSVSVVVPAKRPPSFSDVDLCLRYNEITSQTQLLIDTKPCPLVISNPDITPPMIGYEVQVGGSPAVMYFECARHVMNVTENKACTVSATVYNKVGSSDTITSEKFYTSWLRNITVEHKSSTLLVYYNTASCTTNKGLKIHLSLNIGHFSSINYESDEKVFKIYNIKKTSPLIIRLQVVNKHNENVGIRRVITLYPPAHTPTPTVLPTEGSSDDGELSLPNLRIIIGAVAGSMIFLIVFAITLFFVLRKVTKSVRSKFKVEKEEFEYLTPRRKVASDTMTGSSTEPSTSPSLSLSLSDLTYHEDMEIVHKQNPACIWVPDYEEIVTNVSNTSAL